MATISENLQIIKNSTDAIKQAIIDKGGTIEGDITTWASAISGISGGGSDAGSVFKITNKLNGTLIGGPSYNSSDIEYYNYSFDGGDFASGCVLSITDEFVFPSESGSGMTEPTTAVFKMTSARGIGFSNGNHAISIYGANGCIISKSGAIAMYLGGGGPSSTKTQKVMAVVFDKYGNYDFDTFFMQSKQTCFVEDTLITLANKGTKLVQDVDYNDELLVWNFDESKYDKAKPLWIKKMQISLFYYECKLDNGTILNLVGSNGKCHRLFSIEDGMFISATDMIGKTTYTENGIAKVVSCERVEKEVEFYNLITDYHMNLFANGVLTSCRYNNIYPIQDMKFVKDDRLNRAPQWKLYESFRDHRSLDRFINGLRLYEQLDIPLEDTIKYCENLERLRKNIDDFDENKEIIKNIQDTAVGWIDRDGNSYGFKLYMPGQNNHIILADKICKELNIETDNPSRYLEKEGWVKYTTDFVLNSDDKEINDTQLKSLRKFLNTPNKLKKEGKIRIGDFMSPHLDISEFDTMDKYSFEYRKKHNRRR